ncbi:NAD(P)-binding protein [Agrocybe pediades]|nr:NAD(P)-binding protein [Agrocybe pediades]
MSNKTNLVAFILGAGTNVGAAVAAKLNKEGYRVALGGRNPKPRREDSPYFDVQVDVSKKESIFAAFDTVVKKLGPVNVVVYNAASVAVPSVEGEILSIPVESYEQEAAIGINTFTAAQKALESFRSEVHRHNPKTFIVTGNILPFSHHTIPKWYTLGIQKALESRLVATAANTYQAENIQFYFATLVSKDGGIPGDFYESGPAHAEAYWRLINHEKQEDWNQQFTSDGQKYPHV